MAIHPTDASSLSVFLPVSDKSLEEIKQLDAGYQFTADNGLTFPYREKGLQILTLQEAFEQFPETTFNIDVKNPKILAVDVLASLIKEYHREDTVLVGSFHDIQIQRFRKRMPTVKTAAGPTEVKRFLYATRFYLTWAIRPKYSVFQVPLAIPHKTKSLRIVEIVTPRFIRRAHSKGITVMVWTVNDPTIMKRLIKDGVDGIFTDDPATLINIIQNAQEKE